jgi:UDP-N-acetylmuramoylalanine--D-glutamate ligase
VIELPSYAGRTVAVMGLGKSGASAARALLAAGAKVWAWDDDAARRAEAERARIPLVDLHSSDLGAAATLVWSPGIPHTHPKPHPVATRARAAGIEILCDVELLAQARPDASYVGVTGTNGKSTTTALIGHILKRAGKRVEIGGNLGIPALDLAPLDKGGIYVLEMSSYQLELTPSLVFDVGVLVNISPDHLDRHDGMDGYVAAKRRIFRGQRPGSTAVIGVDDDASRAIHRELARAKLQRVVPISVARVVQDGVYAPDGTLIDASAGAPHPIADLRTIATLPGRHNWQNAAAAYAATRPIGVAPDEIAASLATFPGLRHRQELVAVIDGVRYVNDSKATNADAAEKAILCYDRIYWIAGGRAKEGGIADLKPHFDRIQHAYLIGEAAESFARTLEGQVAYTVARTLDRAVAEAARAAARDGRAGVVVLLSPAGASWDQFANFEARGDAFRAAVETLPGKRAAMAPGIAS